MNIEKVNIGADYDNLLVDRFREGSDESFELLLKKYESKVYNLAMRLTRNIEDSEEVLQDVFITVYRKIESFEGKAKFSSWLYRITVNAAFMKLRKRRQEMYLTPEDLIPRVHNKALEDYYRSSEVRSDAVMLSKEIRGFLEHAISRLTGDYRTVFILRDIDGLSNKEVGEILNLTVPAVKSRLHRSRLMLRKRLRRYYEDYLGEQQRSEQKISIPSLIEEQESLNARSAA